MLTNVAVTTQRDILMTVPPECAVMEDKHTTISSMIAAQMVVSSLWVLVKTGLYDS